MTSLMVGVFILGTACGALISRIAWIGMDFRRMDEHRREWPEGYRFRSEGHLDVIASAPLD
ncbi:hypothetical protein SBA1_270045 [Candidatus Sulfotelmatobacter kueseliae]|uniref:Uncharacterized protein n=1 Tax=Candidatus Sulfotelmatobacter kueseliae TaxID=2042962 RepID=A0A2U3KIF5_9BACT|nr:hypothetical protein SBA1_270045 [Candidatus Sulfotelmatobacter kueseliae]